MMAAEFARLVKHARRRADGVWWDACCPAHADRRASLSFCDGDVSLVVECHAGCSREQIAAGVGRSVVDFAHRADGGPHERRRVIATYDYRDERGTLLFQEVRFEPKDFRLRHPDGKGGWSWTVAGVRRIVYRLDELGEQRGLWLVEGPKDADNLWALGIPATTTPGGAKAWRDEYAQQIRDAGAEEVTACRDNDEPGAAYRHSAAVALARLGVTVRMLDLPDLPPKGDVSDWIAAQRVAGRTEGEIRAALLALADQAPICPRGQPSEVPAEPAITAEGDDYHVRWPGEDLDLLAVAPRESGEGIHAEVTVSLRGSVLSWGRLNLASTSMREGLVRKLCEAAPELPWRDRLEFACRRVAAEVRAGSPIVRATPRLVGDDTRYLLWPFVVRDEVSLVYGDGESMKSYLLMLLMVAIAGPDGLDLPLCRRPTLHGPCLYVDAETTQRTFEDRLARVTTGLGLRAEELAIDYKRLDGVPFHAAAASLRAAVARERYVLVGLDSLGAAGPPEVEGSDAALSTMRALRSLGTSAIAVGHVSRATIDGRAKARVYGSVYYRNAARLAWEARRSEEAVVEGHEAVVGYRMDKVNDGPRVRPFAWRWTFSDTATRISTANLADDAPDLDARRSLPSRIPDALKAGPMTAAALAENLGAEPNSVFAALRRLAKAGRVVKLEPEDDTKGARWANATGRTEGSEP